jgi:hypothetical protein
MRRNNIAQMMLSYGRIREEANVRFGSEADVASTVIALALPMSALRHKRIFLDLENLQSRTGLFIP